MAGHLYPQSIELQSVQLESKENGIIVSLDLDTTVNISNITGWQANSGWFYMTLYKVSGDSTSLSIRTLPDGVKEFQVIESEESIQLGIKIIEPISQFNFSPGEDDRSIVATLLYSTTYLAGLNTIKQMNLKSQERGFPVGVRNWFYITGSGLTLTGLLQNSDDSINTQTKAGIGLLALTFILDKIWSYL